MKNLVFKLGLHLVKAAFWSHAHIQSHTLPGCPVQVERRGLETHLSECTFRRECPNGCGHTLLSHDQSQHNCVAELRTEVEMLRCVCVCVTLLFSFDMFSGNYPTTKTWTGRRCCAKWRS